MGMAFNTGFVAELWFMIAKLTHINLWLTVGLIRGK